MSYRDWRAAFNRHLGSSDPALSAQRWNLENEKRIPKKMPTFKRRVGKEYADLTGAGLTSEQAVTQALETTIEETSKKVDSKWLGELPLTGSPRPPATVVNYRLGSKVRKRNMSKVFSSRRHHRRSVTLHEPMDAEKSPGGTWLPRKRFHWITFSHGGNHPPTDDPTRVKRELGLAHYNEKEVVYRFDLTITDDQDVWVPTCLDAGLGKAWAPPPTSATDPWGRTRDMVDGQPRWPELLVEVEDYFSATPLIGKLVSPPGPAKTIGALTVDYMVGR